MVVEVEVKVEVKPFVVLVVVAECVEPFEEACIESCAEDSFIFAGGFELEVLLSGYPGWILCVQPYLAIP